MLAKRGVTSQRQSLVDKLFRDPELRGNNDGGNKTTKGLVGRANPGIRALNEKSVCDPWAEQISAFGIICIIIMLSRKITTTLSQIYRLNNQQDNRSCTLSSLY